MAESLCGADCSACPLRAGCCGCIKSGEKPFGEECLIASYCKKGTQAFAEFKQKLIDDFNALKISDIDLVTDLNALPGVFFNLEYQLPGGMKAKFWNDNKIYLGNQLPKRNTDRCYGIAGDEHHLMVCEYGENGADAELVLFKRRT